MLSKLYKFSYNAFYVGHVWCAMQFFSTYYKIRFLLHPAVRYYQMKISGKIRYNFHPDSNVILENVRINSGSLVNSFGGHRSVVLRTLKGAQLQIGKNVGISNCTIICSNRITIEDDVLIGGNCHIFDSDFHSTNSKIRNSGKDSAINTDKILFKKGCFIGGGSYILKGVTVGENSIIASRSVVVRSIPDNQVWGGNPAKFLKHIN